ncbi:MAG: hypothetical protein LBS60_06290 [Deltaproteobacteria bacterium]|jgi:hypothetical protein|nr:hypothetical protein [Deltaproteobacteria bacterium]
MKQIFFLFLCGLVCLALFTPNAYAAPENGSVDDQEYTAVMPFPGSEGVVLSFYLNKDLTQVRQFIFAADRKPTDRLVFKSKDPKAGIMGAELRAGFTYTKPIPIVDKKFVLDSFLVIDFTVLDSCLYGTIYAEDTVSGEDMATDKIKVVIPNVTNPKPIPPEIQSFATEK